MALILRDLSFTYAAGTPYAVEALAGVDLEVRPGELVLLLGRTGSGKSTLLRLCAGLDTPTTGTVSADGVAPRGRVGLVFQDPESQLFADTVLADVSFGPRNQGLSAEKARERARAALSETGLDADAFADRSPFGLSGGEARRVAVAGVLAMRMPYVLLDEPTAGLDARGRAAVVAAVERARARAGVLVVTHDAEEFLSLADRVVFLDGGGIAFAADTREVLAAPGRAAVAGMPLPSVVRALQLARARGFDAGPATLDPAEAAMQLARAGGWVR